MKSFDVIRSAVDEPGVKAVAAALHVSPALVYKWCEPPAEDDPDQSGRATRWTACATCTTSPRTSGWCAGCATRPEASSSPIPPPNPRDIEQSVVGETRDMVRDFSELLDAVTESVEDDAVIDAQEADAIRQKWEDLKSCVEHFVVGCEKGHYRVKARGR